MVLYGVVATASVALFESLRKARRRAEEDERQLREEVAARRAAEGELAEREELLRVTFASIGDAVITTDADGRGSPSSTAWPRPSPAGADGGGTRGRPLAEVFRIVNEQTRREVENPAHAGLAGGGGRRARQPHDPDRQGRDRAGDRRQRRPDPGPRTAG